jgi:hypothetical protein
MYAPLRPDPIASFSDAFQAMRTKLDPIASFSDAFQAMRTKLKLLIWINWIAIVASLVPISHLSC